MRDKVTGKAYTGVNGNPYQEIDSGLQKYLPNKSSTGWKVANCAEVDALNKAFKARNGANMKDMNIVTISIGTPEGTDENHNNNAKPCSNCSITTRNAAVINFSGCD